MTDVIPILVVGLLLFVSLSGWFVALNRYRRRCCTPAQALSAVTGNFPDNVLIVNREGRIIAFSQPASEFFGYSPAELRGLDVEALIPKGAAETHRKGRRDFMRGRPGKAMDNEIVCINKDGEEIPAITRVRTFELGGELYGLAAILDLRSFRDREANLRALSERDPLTGLANRRRFDRDLHREWQRALRQARPLAIVMVDADSFKEYNDYHGHPGGDACLETLAGILSEVCKRAPDQVARYGGEEFICLLPETDTEGAAHVARQIRRRVEEANIPHGRSPVSPWVTVSVGAAAVIPTMDQDMGDLVKFADTALYAAKAAGRNGVSVYEEPVRPVLPE
ncbi:sensor domain-containing diguanylate cyclase [Gilvimarinus sp. F26214L]|uniref:sensor domain-containing diguanylate cyclase n=1 Tax=Gilvimarinus sp. DZF01 TaxID=3461371 RepID=UPI0040456C92